MRSSSVKTLTAAVTITLALSVTAPTAQAAKPTRATAGQAQKARDYGRDGFFKTVQRLIQRIFTVSTQDVMAPPIPADRT